MSDYDQKTAAEIQTEIAEIETALSFIRTGGQSYTLTAGPGGTTRTVTNADYSMLVKHRNDLYSQLRTLEGKRAVRMRAGW